MQLLTHRERVTIVLSSRPEKVEELIGPAGAEWVTKRESVEVMQEYLRSSKAETRLLRLQILHK